MTAGTGNSQRVRHTAAKKVTLAHVAKAAGVSQATVSMVLNGREGVSFADETIAAVFSAAETLGYRGGRRAFGGATIPSVLVVAPNVTNPYYSTVIQAIQQAEASVKVAQAAVATAVLTAKNKKDLFDQKIIGSYELQMAENNRITAEANLSQAKAQLITARQNLSYTNVTSPSNGVVGTIPYRVGSLVSSSIATPLTTVSNIDEMFVYFSMTEKQLLEMSRQNGTTANVLKSFPAVQLKLADGSVYTETGKIETVSGVIDQSTGSVRLRATFKNPNHLLKSGGSGSVVIPYKSDNVILIPQTATVEVQDKKYVYVVGADNKVTSTMIEVAQLDNGADYLVTAGLKAGDRIVVEGIASLQDGMQIKPITEAESAAKQEQAVHMSAGLAGKK